MFPSLLALNWIAILVATLCASFLGGLWFTALFGRVYAEALGRRYQPENKLAPIFIIGPLICTVVTTITSSMMVEAFNINSIADGFLFGALVGFGFLAMTTVNTAINPNMPRPLFYGLISGCYFFLAGIIINVVLVAFRQ
ncbi:predicted protein [Naegleria gruberi]|uniref:Predicted protein n=1 Tax=Naegleria gruberi TaxID=5762 RepID=D2VRH0_NAEGR|nr:uncharacterized protein NAEGRDRAFT_71583 [Naegleria gruberi]EFC40672.1 predicted protein [Naegleria gruberi]|eukprot:XP_002673416.1 predicted protein [Naegleria gruberi strain NEG-M]